MYFLILSSIQTCEAQEPLGSSILYILLAYILVDTLLLIIYNVHYMFEILLALSYVLLPYVFVVLLLVIWNKEPPSDKVK